MSILDQPGDELLHYDGGTHRQDPPNGVRVERDVWDRRVREHQQEHLRRAIAAVDPALVRTT